MKKKMEYSKKISLFILITYFLTIGACIVLMFYTGDTSGIEWIIGSISALATTTVGFYFSKARAENVLKIQKKSKGLSIDEVANIFKDRLEE